MRFVLASLALAGLLTPAAVLAADDESHRMAEDLHDPVQQARIAATAEAVTNALLSMPVAPVARAVAEAKGEDPGYVDPDLRTGDLVDPDTIDASREFAHRLPEMMGAMASLAVAMEDLLPELRSRIEAARAAGPGY